jgi:hypothetical protein
LLFPRDCFIAAQLAYTNEQDSLAVDYLLKGVPFGINAELIFESRKEFEIRNLVQSKYWKNYQSSYPKLRADYINRVDWELKKRHLCISRNR